MKAFIERVFKSKKQKKLKEILQEADKFAQDKATEAMVEAIIEEEIKLKKPNHFPDCNCFKCVKWRNQNA